MRFLDYVEHAAETAFFPVEQGPEYTALGLCSEVAELAEAEAAVRVNDVHAELGDCLWYLAMVVRTSGLGDEGLDVDLSSFPAPFGTDTALWVRNLVVGSGYLAGRVKKRIRDGADSVPDEALVDAVWACLVDVAALSWWYGVTVDQVAWWNLDKLASRQGRGVLAGSGDSR